MKRNQARLKINQASSLGILLSDSPSNTINLVSPLGFSFIFPNYIVSFSFILFFRFSSLHMEVYLFEMISTILSSSCSRIYAINVKKKKSISRGAWICLCCVNLGLWVITIGNKWTWLGKWKVVVLLDLGRSRKNSVNYSPFLQASWRFETTYKADKVLISENSLSMF